MPLDTRSKRASAITALRPWMIAPPLPDGTIDQGDRQHIAWMYSGILATTGVITPASRTYAIEGETRILAVEGKDRVYPIESETEGMSERFRR